MNNNKSRKPEASLNSNIQYIGRECKCCGISYRPIDQSRYCIECSLWIYMYNDIDYEDLYV